MYKKASKFLSRQSRSTGEITDFVQEGRKAAFSYLSRKRNRVKQAEKERREREAQRLYEEKQNEIVSCEFCQKQIINSELADHCFFWHDRAKCKFCEKFIQGYALHYHIENEHGTKAYKEWVKSKSKKKVKSDKLRK
jgi:hypothetical protein